MPDDVFVALLLATGRPTRPLVDDAPPVFVVDAGLLGGVDTAWGILERSGVRFKFDLDPVVVVVGVGPFLLLELVGGGG